MIAYLNIITWVGTSAIGASHYRPELKWAEGEDRHSEYRQYRPHRKMSAHERAEENKKAGFKLFLADATTDGYLSENDAIEAGKAAFCKLFNWEEDVLCLADRYEVGPFPILYGPPELCTQAGKLWEEAEALDWYGIWPHRKGKNDKRMHQIEQLWDKLWDPIKKQHVNRHIKAPAGWKIDKE